MTKKKNSYAVVILILVCAGIFAPNFCQYQVSGFGPQLMKAIGLSTSQFAQIATAPLIPGIFLSLVAGILVDKFGARRCMVLAMLLSALGVIWRYFAAGYTAMYFSMIAMGIGATFLSSNNAKILGQWFPPHKIAITVGIYLGVSNGAKFVVALVMVVVVGSYGVMSSWTLVAAALVGSLLVMALVLAVSRRVRSSSVLIVAGVMIGYVCSAATDFLVTFASDQNIVNLRNWSQGSFSGARWDDVAVMAVVVAAALACALALSKPMGAFQLGEGYARSVGVDVRRLRAGLVVLSSVLAGTVTAFAGPVSFVGVAVPHVTKRLLHTSRPLQVIPAAFLGGGVFCLVCDLVARTLLAPTELSISTVTAIFGAPVVLSVLLRRRRE